jgi:hypothetical protein
LCPNLTTELQRKRETALQITLHYHESLDNLTPADVYYGRGQAILDGRVKIKRKTIALRRQLHQKAAA